MPANWAPGVLIGRYTTPAGREQAVTPDVLQTSAVGAANLVAWDANGQLVLVDGGGIPTFADIREMLTANRTYYISTTGSDSNDGLTPGTPFLTAQKGIDTAAMLDLSIYDVTLRFANGTYSTASGLIGKLCVGAGSVILLGDETTPANVTLTTTGIGAFGLLSRNVSTTYAVRGVTLTASGASTGALVATAGSNIDFQNIVFGSGFTQHISSSDSSTVRATGNYSITAGATIHLTASGAGIVRLQAITVTLTGTPNFATAFAYSLRLGAMFLTGDTFSGGATGPRYLVAENAIITTNGAGATYLPGNAAGTVLTGGQYN